MPREYKIEVVKGDKVIQIEECSNHYSQRISEMEWDGHVFDMREIYNKIKKKNE